MDHTPSMLTTHPSSSRPLAPGQVALIGTVHMDRASFGPLRDLLVALAPAVIACETSEFGIHFRRTEGRRIRSVIRRYLRRRRIPRPAAGDLGATMMLLSFPFEYLAARCASRRLGVPLVHLGRDRDSMAWLGRLARESWSPDRLAVLAGTGRDLRAELEAALGRAAHPDTSTIHPGPRDRVYARRIGELSTTGSSVAAILGWEHVLTGVSGNTAWIMQRRVYVWAFVVGGRILRSG